MDPNRIPRTIVVATAAQMLTAASDAHRGVTSGEDGSQA